jgi:hypothetical protein
MEKKMTESTFRNEILDIAKRECKGEATNEEVLWLQKPENRLAWCQSLITALADYESQAIYHRDRVKMLAEDSKVGLVGRSDYMMEKEKFDSWYKKSQRYRNGLSQRLNHVKILMGEDNTVNHVEEMSRLTKAIIAHEVACSESGKAPNPWDLVLWSEIQVLALD